MDKLEEPVAALSETSAETKTKVDAIEAALIAKGVLTQQEINEAA